MNVPDAALPVTRKLLRVLIVLNILVGVVIGAMLVTSIVAPEWLIRALGIRAEPGKHRLLLDMWMIMGLGLASVPLMNRVLRSLVAIVDTVGAGDPFVTENAERLTGIGWLLLGLNLLSLGIGNTLRGPYSNANALGMHWEFSVTPWLAVLLSFVLARVFEHGARMRADLEGTV